MSGLDFINLSTFNIAQSLDRVRTVLLKSSLQSEFLRDIYRDRASRLAFNYAILFGIYFFLSLKVSAALLVFGPVFLGFPHIVASYRFMQAPRPEFNMRWGAAKVFRFFLLLTAVSLGIRFVGQSEVFLPQLPYGGYEILLSLFAPVVIFKGPRMMASVMAIGLMALILRLAWVNPLAFVGIALILHNWVAFGHWYLAAKNFNDRLVVILATLLFAAAHGTVAVGFLDSWISFPELNFFSSRSFEIRGWTLAPWSNDPTVWNRFIVLYAFGLSMHYFVWLRAIPQCLDKNSVPNSFRASLKKLRDDCGAKGTALIFLGGIAFLGLWLCTSFAGVVYFGVAMLHGWLELALLIFAFFTNIINYHSKPANTTTPSWASSVSFVSCFKTR